MIIITIKSDNSLASALSIPINFLYEKNVNAEANRKEVLEKAKEIINNELDSLIQLYSEQENKA